MTLHFAYGSNMSRPLMARRCPTAQPVGAATLRGWRYVITRDGYASIVRAPGQSVHGAVWRLGARDLAALNIYEDLASGLYRRRTLPVRLGPRTVRALIYLGRDPGPGKPQIGYHAVVLAAAQAWQFPSAYVAALTRWSPSLRPHPMSVAERGA